MAKKPSGTGTTETAHIITMERTSISLCVLGKTPLICNRVSQKVREQLLFPAKKKTRGQNEQSLKHNPLQEFRDSPYRSMDDNSPTLLTALSVWFKKSMMTAALDTPGAKKTQIGRLVYVEHERVPLYGLPKMMMAVTRSADINRTPDVRTRCVLPEWGVILKVSFATPALREKDILNLIGSAGYFSGVGDWRTEKGSGNYGSFEIVGIDDPRLAEVMRYGRAEQVEAMNNPQFYDDETESLYEFWCQQAEAHGYKAAS